jgi:hypothetical protein
MLIRREQARREQITEKSDVLDYATGELLGLAVTELHGRVPKFGSYVNRVCHEAGYVLAGIGVVFVEDEKYNVSGGDAFTIKPFERHHIVADNLKLLIVTCPNWYAAQCEIIEEKKS